MSNKPVNAPIAPAVSVSDIADLRAAIAENAKATNESILLAVQAMLSAQKTTRARKATVPATLSPVDAICAQAGFRSGSARNKLFVSLYMLGAGDYPLSDFPGVNTGDANVVSRRLARKGLPFSLAIDGEERGAARVIFADLRKPVESTEGEKSE